MTRFAFALAIALFCAVGANAQILATKHYPSWQEASTRWALCNAVADADPRCVFRPDPNNDSYQDTGFGITFVKIRSDTGLRCAIAGDFIVNAPSSVNQLITIDGGGSWGIGKGHSAPLGWTADFWGYTFIDVPSGSHQIHYSLFNAGATETLFYVKYAMLQCFEETLGARQ